MIRKKYGKTTQLISLSTARAPCNLFPATTRLLTVDFEGFSGEVDRHVLSSWVNLLQEVLKGKLNLLVSNSGRLNILHIAVLLTQLLRLLCRYLASAWIILDQVYLIADEHDADVLLSWVEKWLQPVLDVVKCFAISHIVDDQASEGFAIMSHRNSSVLLLASGIP